MAKDKEKKGAPKDHDTEEEKHEVHEGEEEAGEEDGDEDREDDERYKEDNGEEGGKDVGEDEEGVAVEDGDGEEDEDGEEEEDIKDYRTMKRKKAIDRERKRKKSKSRTRALVAGGVVLIVVMVSLWYLFYGPAQVTEINVRVTRIENDKVDIITTLDVKSGVAQGNANLRITLNGTDVYTGTMPISENRGHYEIDYEEFVTRNGIYDASISFQGHSGHSSIIVNTVAERLEFTHGPTSNSGNVEWSMSFIMMGYDPDLGVFAAITASPGESFKATIQGPSVSDSIGQVDMGGMNKYIVDKYKFAKSGTYTIKAEFTNQNVTSDSPFKHIEAEETFFVNAFPIAKVVPDDQTIHLIILEQGKATIDLSSSRDDGVIKKYMADFGEYNDPDKNETWNSQDLVVSTMPVLEYQYTIPTGPTDLYEIVASVEDDYGNRTSVIANIQVLSP